jgi:hypothetical protein
MKNMRGMRMKKAQGKRISAAIFAAAMWTTIVAGARYEIRSQRSADSPASLPHAEGRMGRRLHAVHRCDASAVARRRFALADRAADSHRL